MGHDFHAACNGWNFWKSPKVPPAALPERPRQDTLGFESSCLYPVTLQDAAGAVRL